jgi:hypothetical protein
MGGDRTDPGTRADQRVRALERRHRAGRTAGGVALLGLAAAMPVAGAALPGGDGPVVGAVIGSLALAGAAAAVWPWPWSAAERRHHELEAMWREARPAAETAAPWDRYAAWARADDERVELLLLHCAGKTNAPSPYGAEVVHRLDPDEMEEAATAMEDLRERAASREAAAREAHLDALSAAERRAYDDALRRIEADADEDRRHAEQAMRRELAAQEAAERRAQASALARALRRR